MEVECIPAPEPYFKGRNGWIRKSFQRQSGASKGHVDKYWYSPQLKIKLRSIVEVKRFLDALETREANGNEQVAYNLLKKTRQTKNDRVIDNGSISSKKRKVRENNGNYDDQDTRDLSKRKRKRFAAEATTSTIMMEPQTPQASQFATSAIKQNMLKRNNSNQQSHHSTFQKVQTSDLKYHPMYVQMNQYHFHDYNPQLQQQLPYYNYNGGPPLMIPVGGGNDAFTSKNNNGTIYKSESFCQFSQMIQRRE